MASITSPGLGSGLDVQGLVGQLVAAERQPAELRLNRKEAVLTQELSGYGSLKSAMSQFQGSLASLLSFSSFEKTTASVSDTAVYTATASDTAQPSSYSIDVTTLAEAHKIASGSYANTTDSVGTGTLTFQFGTYASGPNTFTLNASKSTQTVTIASGDNSLEGIRNAVNKADIGVQASIINNGTGNILVFTSKDSGAANSLKVTVSDADMVNTDTSGLSQLAYDPTGIAGSGKNMTEKNAAVDAALTIDGIAITSASNTISSAIQGVTLNLKSVGAGVSLAVTRDTNSIKSLAEGFVKNYNGLMGAIQSLTGYDAGTGQAGVLQGDSIARSAASQMRDLLGTTVSGLSGAYQSLGDIGITSNKFGLLEINSAKLSAAISADYAAVASLFSVTGQPSDPLIKYVSSSDDTQVGDYAVNITSLATQGVNVGTASGSLIVDANNDNFSLKVDGIQSATINLTHNATGYSTTELASELQSRINADSALQAAGVSVTVAYATNHFEITSSRYGSASTVDFTTVDTNTAATIGFSAGTGIVGADAVGTLGGAAASGSGRYLTGTVGNTKDLKIEVLGGAAPSGRGTVNFTRGLAYQFDQMLQGYLGRDSMIDDRTSGINDRIKDISNQRTRLDQRMGQLEARYLAQFTALDGLISQFTNTGTFLTQQLANLPGFG